MKCNQNDAMNSGFEEHFAPIKAQASILEKRLQEWKEKLFEFRLRNPLMNYFTVKQCLVLQKHLYTLSKNIKNVNTLPPQVFILLKCIAEDVTVKKIEYAFYISSLSDDDNKNANGWKKARSEQPTNFTDCTLHELQGHIELLQDDYGIEENIALASLMKCYPYVLDEVIFWCKEQDPASDITDDLANEAEEELKKLGELSKHENVEEEEEEKTDNGEIVAPFISLQQFGLFLNGLLKGTPIDYNMVSMVALCRF